MKLPDCRDRSAAGVPLDCIDDIFLGVFLTTFCATPRVVGFLDASGSSWAWFFVLYFGMVGVGVSPLALTYD